MKLAVLDLHLDEIQVDRVINRRGPHKLGTSENEQNRMTEENIENASKRVKIPENKKIVGTCTRKCKWMVKAGPCVLRSGNLNSNYRITRQKRFNNVILMITHSIDDTK